MKKEIRLILNELRKIENTEGSDKITRKKIDEICENHGVTFEELRNSVLRILADEIGISIDELESLSFKEIKEEDLMNVSGGASKMQRITAASLAALLGCNTFVSPRAEGADISNEHLANVKRHDQGELAEQYDDDDEFDEQDDNFDEESVGDKQKFKWLAGLCSLTVATILGVPILRNFLASPDQNVEENTKSGSPEFKALCSKRDADELFKKLIRQDVFNKYNIWMTDDCFRAYNNAYSCELPSENVYIIAYSPNEEGLTDVLLHTEIVKPNEIYALRKQKVDVDKSAFTGYPKDASSKWLAEKLKDCYGTADAQNSHTSDDRRGEHPTATSDKTPVPPYPKKSSDESSSAQGNYTSDSKIPEGIKVGQSSEHPTTELDEIPEPPQDPTQHTPPALPQLQLPHPPQSSSQSPSPLPSPIAPMAMQQSQDTHESGSAQVPKFKPIHQFKSPKGLFEKLQQPTVSNDCKIWVTNDCLEEYQKRSDTKLCIVAYAPNRKNPTDVLLHTERLQTRFSLDKLTKQQVEFDKSAFNYNNSANDFSKWIAEKLKDCYGTADAQDNKTPEGIKVYQSNEYPTTQLNEITKSSSSSGSFNAVPKNTEGKPNEQTKNSAQSTSMVASGGSIAGQEPQSSSSPSPSPSFLPSNGASSEHMQQTVWYEYRVPAVSRSSSIQGVFGLKSGCFSSSFYTTERDLEKVKEKLKKRFCIQHQMNRFTQEEYEIAKKERGVKFNDGGQAFGNHYYDFEGVSHAIEDITRQEVPVRIYNCGDHESPKEWCCIIYSGRVKAKTIVYLPNRSHFDSDESWQDFRLKVSTFDGMIRHTKELISAPPERSTVKLIEGIADDSCELLDNDLECTGISMTTKWLS